MRFESSNLYEVYHLLHSKSPASIYCNEYYLLLNWSGIYYTSDTKILLYNCLIKCCITFTACCRYVVIYVGAWRSRVRKCACFYNWNSKPMLLYSTAVTSSEIYSPQALWQLLSCLKYTGQLGFRNKDDLTMTSLAHRWFRKLGF